MVKLSEKNFIDSIKHYDGCDCTGLENISYEEKKKMALEEANEYIKDCNTIEDAWNKIRNNEECFTEKNGCFDTGNLYLNIALLTAIKEKPIIYWDVRED